MSASEILPDNRGGLWWEWPDKRGGLLWEWPDKRGGLLWEWPYTTGTQLTIFAAVASWG